MTNSCHFPGEGVFVLGHESIALRGTLLRWSRGRLKLEEADLADEDVSLAVCLWRLSPLNSSGSSEEHWPNTE